MVSRDTKKEFTIRDAEEMERVRAIVEEETVREALSNPACRRLVSRMLALTGYDQDIHVVDGNYVTDVPGTFRAYGRRSVGLDQLNIMLTVRPDIVNIMRAESVAFEEKYTFREEREEKDEND